MVLVEVSFVHDADVNPLAHDITNAGPNKHKDREASNKAVEVDLCLFQSHVLKVEDVVYSSDHLFNCVLVVLFWWHDLRLDWINSWLNINRIDERFWDEIGIVFNWFVNCFICSKHRINLNVVFWFSSFVCVDILLEVDRSAQRHV